MAELTASPTNVTVRLSPAEQVWALRGDVTVPRSAVVSAVVRDDGLRAVEGLRAPGLGLPGVAKVGTWRGRWGKDLVVVRRAQPAVVVELTGAPWRRLLVSYADRAAAERAAADVRGD